MKLNQYEWDPAKDLRGEGAFAEVFEARDAQGDSVALKIYRESVNKSSSGGSQKSKYSLESEFKKGKLLSHTHVIRYLGLDYLTHVDVMNRETSYPVLIMEYADGGNLEGWLKSGNPPTETELITILTEVLKGLHYLHEEGIIHRDLKPGNILFKSGKRGNKVAKIADFGISRDVLEENLASMSTTTGIGTTGYMAPEQFLNKTFGLNGSISNRVDLWGIGVILYKALTGKMPFGYENISYEALQEEITQKEPSYAQIPVRFIPVLTGCFQKHAASRFANAEEVIDALQGNKSATRKDADLDSKTTIKKENNFDGRTTIIVPKKEVNTDPNKDHGTKPKIVPSKRDKTAGRLALGAVGLLVLFILARIIGHAIDTHHSNSGNNYGSDTSSQRTNQNQVNTNTGNTANTGDAYLVNHVYGAGTENEVSYTGPSKNGKANGYGTWNFKDGSIYIGNSTDGLFEGQGAYTRPGGYKYAGNFANGKRDGQGTFTYPDGKVYKGDFKADSLEGKATIFYADKTTVYDGEVKSGQPYGYGTCTFGNGESYEGYMTNGYRNGQGTEKYANGSSLSGVWIYNAKDGAFTYKDANGVSTDQKYANGQLVSQ